MKCQDYREIWKKEKKEAVVVCQASIGFAAREIRIRVQDKHHKYLFRLSWNAYVLL